MATAKASVTDPVPFVGRRPAFAATGGLRRTKRPHIPSRTTSARRKTCMVRAAAVIFAVWVACAGAALECPTDLLVRPEYELLNAAVTEVQAAVSGITTELDMLEHNLAQVLSCASTGAELHAYLDTCYGQASALPLWRARASTRSQLTGLPDYLHAMSARRFMGVIDMVIPKQYFTSMAGVQHVADMVPLDHGLEVVADGARRIRT